MSPFFAEARARLMRRVVIDPVTGCWLFQGSHSGSGRGGGYGRLRYRGQYWAAHRLSFLAWKGPIPKGRQAGHTCPCNPPPRNCINPDHLQAMTHLRNQRQRSRQMRERAAFVHSRAVA